MSQIGGGVLTRSSSKKVPRASGEDVAPSPSSSGGPSASSRTPLFPQPRFGGYTLPPGDLEDPFDDYFRNSPPSPSPLTRPSESSNSMCQTSFMTPAIGFPTVSDHSAPSSLLSVLTNMSPAQGKLHDPKDAPPAHEEHSSAPSIVQSPPEAPTIPFQIGIPGFPVTIPKDFDVLAAQSPADDEVLGACCSVSFDGEEEDFDASPSRQRAGRIPNDHKEAIDEGVRKIDAIIAKMHEKTGRTSENLLNHYLASKGFKRVGRSVWNQYQKYFAAFRVEERVACGNPTAKCKSLHFIL
jgi:hypothetical protein